jgi:hypothetical protein
MKNIFNESLRILKTRVFVISFLASLCVVGVIFFILVMTQIERDEYAEYVFNDYPNAERVLWLPSPPPEVIEEPEEVEEFPPDTQLSILTGLRVHDDIAGRRPLAIVINNIRQSLPQSGIASADIVYEVLAEGDVTRFVAIFQTYVPEKIGSVRSARDYFIDFAFNHDAIFLYHGASPGGHERVRSTGITNMDGGRLEGRVFWRDRTFPDWSPNRGETRSLEHSSYTGREQIEEHLEANEIRDYIGDNPAFGFIFGELPESLEKIGEARNISIPFSRPYTRTFIFDEEENIYRVENTNGPHQDALTQEQVSVTNILIQLAQMSLVGDYAGRRSVNTIGNGSGYFVNSGVYYPVRWEKSSHSSPARWTFEDGTPLVLSPGKTWICVFSASGTVEFE